MSYSSERIVRDLLERFRQKVGVRVPDGWGVHFLLVAPSGELRSTHNFTVAARLADHLEVAARHVRQKAALVAAGAPKAPVSADAAGPPSEPAAGLGGGA